METTNPDGVLYRKRYDYDHYPTWLDVVDTLIKCGVLFLCPEIGMGGS
jgi:hypothetical protein